VNKKVVAEAINPIHGSVNYIKELKMLFGKNYYEVKRLVINFLDKNQSIDLF